MILEMFRFVFGFLFWMPALLLLCMLQTSLDAGFHMTTTDCQALILVSLIAGGSIWMKRRQSLKWTRAAFAVFSVGLLRVIFEHNHYGIYAAVIWCVALLTVVWQRHVHQRHSKAGSTRSGVVDSIYARPQQSVQAGLVSAQYSYDHVIRRAQYSFADIIGMAETKSRLLLAAREIVSGNAGGRNGILLFGEPGNGKTLLAEALAGELGIPFFPITYGDVASKFVNETPQKASSTFEHAKRNTPCLMLIDEYDSFCKPRDAGAHHMDQDLTNVMLTEIVACRRKPIVLVAATNCFERLDRASIREGRFDYKIEVPPPDLEARRAILRKSIGGAPGLAAVDMAVVDSLAERWDGFGTSRLTALGGQLSEMQRDGTIANSRITFETCMRAMRLLAGRRGALPANVKTIDEIIMPEQSHDALRDLAFKMRHVYRLEKMGGQMPRGLLFFGAPGTGKTQAAMALVKAADFAFLKTTGAEIIANPEAFDVLIKEAYDIRPVIVFIDESDDILRDRRYSNVASITNRILTALDGSDGRVRDVIYIAATNHIDAIDPAALRGGRFSERIFFDVPSSARLERYIVSKLRQMAGARYVIMPGVRDRLNEVLAGKSIADTEALLQRMIDTAAVRVLRHQVAEINSDDVSVAASAMFAASGRLKEVKMSR
ncbi:AAA family ATPase [Paraburkholderia bengalensis]|uniref:AAA family ATPase n=1 Tax=Paraburkholderia bengalensis TaxID=2747562 RepID=UPI00301429A9